MACTDGKIDVIHRFAHKNLTIEGTASEKNSKFEKSVIIIRAGRSFFTLILNLHQKHQIKQQNDHLIKSLLQYTNCIYFHSFIRYMYTQPQNE